MKKLHSQSSKLSLTSKTFLMLSVTSFLGQSLLAQGMGNFRPFQPDRPSRPGHIQERPVSPIGPVPSRPVVPPSHRDEHRDDSRDHDELPSGPGRIGHGGGRHDERRVELVKHELIINEVFSRGGSIDILDRAIGGHRYSFSTETLRQKLRGRTITEVILVGSTARGFGKAKLISNRMTLNGQSTVPTYTSDTVFSLSSNNVVDHSLGELTLELEGNFTVEKVIVVEEQISSRPIERPRTEVLPFPMNRGLNRGELYQIGNLVPISSLYGKEALTLRIEFSSLLGRDFPSLTISEMRGGTIQELISKSARGALSEVLELDVSRKSIGEIDRLRLTTNGRVSITKIEVVVKAVGFPRQQKDFSMSLSTNIGVGTPLNLSKVINLDIGQNQDLVKEVELSVDLRYGGRGSQVQVCSKYMTTDCGRVSFVDRDSQLKLEIPWGLRIGDAEVRVVGQILTRALRVKLQ